jgi:hypothetical protein
MRSLKGLLAAVVTVACVSPVLAIPVTPGGGPVVLSGTTVGAQPDLAGTVLADVVTQWDGAIDPMYGFPGATGTLQSRVVRSDDTGFLDFYWRINVAPPSYPNYVPQQLNITGLDLANFLTGTSFDANYRLDGLGSTAPVSASSADPSSFLYQFSLSSFGPGSSSYFLLLRSNATDFAQSALASIGVTSVSTFAPVAAVPEPETYALMMAGLALMGFVAKRRQS